MEGHPSHRGDKILASVLHFNPKMGRLAHAQLPRAVRALKGWRRLAPGQSRKAWPLPVWAAVAHELVRQQQLPMALYMMLGLCSYPRPAELLAIRKMSLVPPTPQVTEFWSFLLNPSEFNKPSKTAEFDSSVLIDTKYMLPWVKVLLKELSMGRKEETVWDFTYAEFSQGFLEVTSKLKIPSLTPYQWRHSGPSIDMARHQRTLGEIQKRGRWKSFKSVTRYEKAARLAANFAELPVNLQRHCLECESQLGDVMQGRTKPLIPP